MGKNLGHGVQQELESQMPTVVCKITHMVMTYMAHSSVGKESPTAFSKGALLGFGVAALIALGLIMIM